MVEDVWSEILKEANQVLKSQVSMRQLIGSYILDHDGLTSSLAFILGQKLGNTHMTASIISDLAKIAHSSTDLSVAACFDITAVKERDPACVRFIQPLLYFKGFLALQAYRLSNYLFYKGKEDYAYFIQMRSSEIFGVDIHPAARIGKSIMIDHAHSIVIGETAVVGDNVSMLHNVTLGGTGKDSGDRHPKVGDGVLLGAGCSVLGNITVGRCSKVASGSVVLSSVPEYKTVAGVPAKIVGESGCDQPSKSMDHKL
ncbi:MAG: serine O-acetyltransferase [Pseudomonadota bacterium]|nr:serine O-acetyltransferase [Pseudomonadota bacterium]